MAEHRQVRACSRSPTDFPMSPTDTPPTRFPYVSYCSLSWDDNFLCVYAQCMQQKTSKSKTIALVAGQNRNSCFFDIYGCVLAMCHQRYSPDQCASWLLPALQQVAQPGTKVGTFVKALLPAEHKGSNKGYAKHAVQALPPGATAGGMRAGAITALSACMPQEHVAMVSGHDLTGVSALYEYLRADRATATAGAIVLAGWPAFEWGSTGKPPAPATLPLLSR